MKWRAITADGKEVHIVPAWDQIAHTTETHSCQCRPKVTHSHAQVLIKHRRQYVAA